MIKPLPRLELADRRPAFEGEAVIIVDGDELNTISIDLEEGNPLDLADRLIRLVNNQELIVTALLAAAHALRSYQHGNAAPDLARDLAAHCDLVRAQIGAAA